MNAAAYVGRVGSLAVALGVGIAVATGYGAGMAWADPSATGASSAESSETEASSTGAGDPAEPASAEEVDPESETDLEDESELELEIEDESEPDAEDESELEPESEADVEVDPEPQEEPETAPEAEPEPEPESEAEPEAGQPDGAAEAPAEEPVEPSLTATSNAARFDAGEDVTGKAAFDDTVGAAVPETTAVTITSFAAQTMSPTAANIPLNSPAFPSLRPWPTAFDPATAITYVTGIVFSLVNAVLAPFAAGLPAPPSGPPTVWTLLAWVRRELFNSTPHVSAELPPYTQSLVDGEVIITGNVGITDPDGDPMFFTVVGRPLNGGVVDVDADGNFTYRPMNAMAAVGGWDAFTVVADDQAAGLHVHGPGGLLQFVPIVGNLVYPGGGHRTTRTVIVNVTAVEGVDLSFPDGFHWGVAHSGFQAEGGPGVPMDVNSDWYRWTHDPFNQQLGLTRGVPEDGPGAYLNYDADAALARDELGMNTFRMGIEWSRIFPESTASVDISDEGGGVSLADLEALDALANQEEVEHYRDVLASLRAHGLEPMVTVTHFTLPVWVHDPATTRLLVQVGLPAHSAGWLSSSTPVEFEKYAAYLAWKYGDQVDYWVTLNEPFPPILTQYLSPPIPGSPIPHWPPGIVRPDLAATFLVNQAKGHVAAYDAIHAWDTISATEGQPAAFVGFSNNMIPARPANPNNPLDVQAADAWNRFYNLWFPNAVIDGWVDANFDGIKTLDEIHPEFKDKVDFLGVQYYGSSPMQGFGLAFIPGIPFLQGIPVQCSPSSPSCSDFNQPTDPGGFREVLEVAASYGKPLWITENGIADAGDSKRPPYLTNHIAVVQDLVAHGVDIRGYTYWSFVDNLEWAHGYDLHFGLYGSDPTTPELERTPKPDSIAAISAITGANALPIELLQKYVPSVV